MAMDVTDLPDPDSPTMASVLPGLTSKSRLSTARNTPLSVLKSTDTPRTDNSGAVEEAVVLDNVDSHSEVAARAAWSYRPERARKVLANWWLASSAAGESMNDLTRHCSRTSA
ncbi:hypothetical protein D3C71_1320730 [compost metagenome]